MIKKKNLVFLLILVLLNNCSFDDKTGIWGGSKKEKRRISQLEKEQGKIIDVTTIYSSGDIYSKEIALVQNISLSKPEKNLSWEMSSLNHQNFLGNIYLSGVDNIFLKIYYLSLINKCYQGNFDDLNLTFSMTSFFQVLIN